MSNLIKILLLEAELFHSDRRTDGRANMTKLAVALHNSANARKKCKVICSKHHRLFDIITCSS